MKWNKNNVTTERGNHYSVIAKFDTSDFWFHVPCNCWTGCQIKYFRKAGKQLNAKAVELKYFHEAPNCNKLIGIIDYPDGVIAFREELDVPEGARREFKYYELKELLK